MELLLNKLENDINQISMISMTKQIKSKLNR